MNKTIENSRVLAVAVASRLTMSANEFLAWRCTLQGLAYVAEGDSGATIGVSGRTFTARVGELEITGCPTVDSAQTAASVALRLGLAG